MSKHPMRDYIEQRVANQRELGVPIAKYQAVIAITGNSRKEISDRVRSLDVNWDYNYGDRDTIDSTDGTTSILMEHTNPEQTPEAYDDELMAWSRARRDAVSAAPSEALIRTERNDERANQPNYGPSVPGTLRVRRHHLALATTSR